MHKIRFLAHDDINKQKWDACLTHAFNGNVYATSWYLDIIHPGWAALVEDDYVRVMPLPLKKKYGITYAYQPFFAQQHGVFSVSLLTPDIVTEFIKRIPAYVRVINLNLNSVSAPDPAVFPVTKYSNFMLDLINEYPVLHNKFNTNTRRNLKVAEKSGLTMTPSLNHEEIISLFRDNRGKEVSKWTDQHYQTLNRLMYQAVYQGIGLSYGVYNAHNELVSGAFFLKRAGRLIFLFSGTSEQGRKVSALTFLIDAVIKDFAPGKFILDFEGSNDSDLARYYAGFGARETSYYNLQLNRLSPISKLMFKMLSRLKSSV